MLKQEHRAAAIVGAHAVLFCALAWWSWLKWPDPLVDFGRELYMPWQITRGKVLFRDIESLFGPLSPYLNALWFRLFGVSLLTLVGVNLAVLAGIIAGLHRLLRLSTDRYTATVASLVALALFGFLQLSSGGNYNFVTPYAHEATHGMALAVASMLALQAAVALRRLVPAVIAGVAFGALLLTKPEIATAAAAAVVVLFAAVAALGASERRRLRALVPLFLGSAAVPPLLFYAYFRRYMDAATAFSGVARGWTAALHPSVTANAFYLKGMGLDRPVFNIILMLLMFAALAAYIAAAAAVFWTGRRASGWLKRCAALVLLASAPAAMVLGFTRALPLAALAAALIAALALRKRRQDRTAAMPLLGLLMWCTFALVLLAKLGLNVRFHQYGFFLALPATTVVVVILCWLVPLGLEMYRSRDAARGFRRLATMSVVAAVVPYLVASGAVYRTKTVAVGSGADRFLASETEEYRHGVATRDALQALQSLHRPGDTLAVLPEGAMLNYLSRLDSPLRVVNVMPPEVQVFGEDEILGALRAAPPRFVMLVPKNMSEYGYPVFGADARYGQRTYSWIAAHYRPINTFGGAPAGSPHNLELLQRR